MPCNLKLQCNKGLEETSRSMENDDKYTWTSSDGKTHNQTDHILIERQGYLSIPDHSQQQTVILTTIRWWQKLGGD
jgi:hypothetical protein